MLFMRIMDVFLSVPSMVLAIAVVTALGTSTFNLLLSLAAPRLARFARVARAAVMAQKDKEFVEATRAVGANNFYDHYKIYPAEFPCADFGSVIVGYGRRGPGNHRPFPILASESSPRSRNGVPC